MEKLCEACKSREQCQTPCKAVNAILWANNHVMERHFEDRIEVYPQHVREVQFSDLPEGKTDEFSTADVIPWSSGDARMTQTAVFIERFFNKTPCAQLAEQFGVKENTIVCMYRNAVEHLDHIIKALDARKEGLKAIKAGKFTDDQKYFLLVSIFGFSGAEVARMFNRDRNRVNMKVKRMTDRFETLFAGEGPKEETAIDDPPIEGKLTRADIVSLVEAYTEQGLSHRQAFQRIAERQAELLGRPVKMRAVESRYYKATAAR